MKIRRRALLIGVSEYSLPIFPPLPAACKDIEKLSAVLEDQNVGDFEVETLENPTAQTMQNTIEEFLRNQGHEDVVLLYYSGHGFLDNNSKFYLATKDTDPSKSTTKVEDKWLRGVIEANHLKRVVVILDCCFSGAFLLDSKGSSQNSTDSLNPEGQFFFCASQSDEYASSKSDTLLSRFTNYMIEGIESADADKNNDGWITCDELYEYVKQASIKSAPNASPRMSAKYEGAKIRIAKVSDPKIIYRKTVNQYIGQNGQLSPAAQEACRRKRISLLISDEDAGVVERECIAAYRQPENIWNAYRDFLKVNPNQREKRIFQQDHNIKSRQAALFEIKWQFRQVILDSVLQRNVLVIGGSAIVVFLVIYAYSVYSQNEFSNAQKIDEAERYKRVGNYSECQKSVSEVLNNPDAKIIRDQCFIAENIQSLPSLSRPKAENQSIKSLSLSTNSEILVVSPNSGFPEYWRINRDDQRTSSNNTLVTSQDSQQPDYDLITTHTNTKDIFNSLVLCTQKEAEEAFLLVSTPKGEIKLRNLDTGSELPLGVSDIPKESVVKISPDGKYAVIAHPSKNSIQIVNLTTGTSKRDLIPEMTAIQSLAFSSQNLLAIGGSGRMQPASSESTADRESEGEYQPGVIIVRRLEDSKTLSKHDVSGAVNIMTFSGNGKILLAGSTQSKLFAISQDQLFSSSRPSSLTEAFQQERIRSIAINYDGTLFALSTASQGLSLWGSFRDASWQRLQDIDSQSTELTALIFSVDNKLILGGSSNGSVEIWGIENYSPRAL
jgi:WD40 repeat protein